MHIIKHFISKPKIPGYATGGGGSAGGSTGASAGGAGTGGASAGGTVGGTGGAGAGGTGGAGDGAGDGRTGGASGGDGAGNVSTSASISFLMSSSGTQSLYRLYNLTLFHSLHHNLLSLKLSWKSMITGTKGYVHFKNSLYR